MLVEGWCIGVELLLLQPYAEYLSTTYSDRHPTEKNAGLLVDESSCVAGSEAVECDACEAQQK